MTDLLGRKETAFENAAWLRYKIQSQLDTNAHKIYEINPYTDVDILVKQLFAIDKSIQWTNLNEEIEIGKYRLIVDLMDNIIKINFLNPSQNLVINEKNIDSLFFLLDDTRQKYNLKIGNTIEIVKQPKFDLYLDTNEIALGKIFNFEIEQCCLMIQL